jgi:PTH1 family peptidyl-tRNA hydrolase
MSKPNPNLSKKFKSISRTIQQEQNAKALKSKNQGSFPKYLKGSRNITSQPFRKTFFGVGNHFYPQSRASVGIWIIEEWAKKHHLTFDEEFDIHSATAENELCTLVRPETYLIENNAKSLLAVSHALQTSLDRVVIIHHEEKLELGQVQLVFGGHALHNQALFGIKELLGTEKFGRIAVGVGHPNWKAVQGRYLPTWTIGDHDYMNRFLQNKFPPNEMAMMEQILMPKIFEVMDVAMQAQSVDDFNYTVSLSYKEVEEQYNEYLKGRSITAENHF